MNQLSHNALVVISLLLAVGIVWIKGQERIDRRPLRGIQVTVENQPDNLLLPDPWIPPTAGVVIVGPRNITESVREDQTSFRVDLSKITLPKDESPVTVFLMPEMFRTNLDSTDRDKITLAEGSVWPSQVLIHVLPWEIGAERPDPTKLEVEDNQILIPLMRIEKRIPVVVPHAGELPEGLRLNKIVSDPDEILITGRREAVDRIESVSTPILDLQSFQGDDVVSMYLNSTWDSGVRAVRDDIRSVTVTVDVEKARKQP